MKTALKPALWIDTPSALKAAIRRLSAEPRLAVDTESNGLHAYREQVCLIQLSIPEDDYLIDPLALDNLSPLGALLADASIEKVFHAAEYDLICLQRDFGFTLHNLFDTMLAARILNYPAVGLNALLTQKFNIHLNKRYQKANWARRPLPAEMLDYARMDTHYLLALRDLLEDELRASGWLPLAQEDFALACQVTPTKAQPPAWERILKNERLPRKQTAILQALAAWREEKAARKNRPTFKILGNKKLLEIARHLPATKNDLRAAGLSEKQIQYWGAEILQVVAEAKDKTPRSRSPWHYEDPRFIERLNALKAWRKAEGMRRGAPSDAILPRSIMEAIARQNPSTASSLQKIMSATPWRYQHFGASILSVLHRYQIRRS